MDESLSEPAAASREGQPALASTDPYPGSMADASGFLFPPDDLGFSPAPAAPASTAVALDAPQALSFEAAATLELEPVAEPEPAAEAAALKPMPLGRIIALANQKGGVGKTTTAINLGAALAEQGGKVLLVDFDPQGALSVGLGLNPNSLESTIYNLLLDAGTSFEEVVHQSGLDGLDLLPSNIDLAAAEILLVSEVAREQALKRALEPALQTYNYILIDCPPSLGLLTINALTASDKVIIPLECEYFALRGMALLVDTIQKVQKLLNPQLEIEGIVATMLDGRTIHGREVLSRVTDAFGDKVFQTVIHKTIRFAEAPVAGEPILTYASASNGAAEYRQLAREVIQR